MCRILTRGELKCAVTTASESGLNHEMTRFLHIADLHLGMRITRFSPDAIDKIREARFKALENVREAAASEARDCQFVILAGDLFDDVRVKRTIAQRAFDLLESFPVHVLMISGNHDPLEPGAVWESDPWNRPDASRVRLLRERQPFREIPGVTVFPCPVFRKTSTEDPTRWIAEHPRQPDDGVRIAVAHGSVMDRPGLPDDDHPISPTAPADLDLDYVALGHWHGPKRYAEGRMAYCGVHEPMRFAGAVDLSGWRPYSTGRDRQEFADDGRGRALSVSIDGPQAVPVIEEKLVHRLHWRTRAESVHDADRLQTILADIADFPQSELTLLRLSLSGTLPLDALQRLDELREVLGRYVVGELDDLELHVKPTDDEIREVAGGGILRTVYDRLLQQPEPAAAANAGPSAADGNVSAVAERAMLLLYRYARQAQEAT